MFHDDLFQKCMLVERMRSTFERKKKKTAAGTAHAGLLKLAGQLEEPPGSKSPRFFRSLQYLPDPSVFGPQDVELAQGMFRRVLERGGTDSTYMQKYLLEGMALASDTRSVPFWLELLNLRRARDTFGPIRRRMAAGALAFLIVRHDDYHAREGLRAASRCEFSEVRTVAIEYLGCAYIGGDRAMPPEIVEDFSLAAACASSEARFMARRVMRDAELPVPLDNPGGIYSFRVTICRVGRAWRMIELESGQTLDRLHYAIQGAFDWDADHLYCFYMGGKARDERFRIGCPHESDADLCTDEVRIGELGLAKGQVFLYLFDYGDENEFDVKVTDVRQKEGRGRYPREVARHGESPEQYHSWDGGA